MIHDRRCATGQDEEEVLPITAGPHPRLGLALPRREAIKTTNKTSFYRSFLLFLVFIAFIVFIYTLLHREG